MAKGRNQKLKLLYLAKIFEEETDEAHGLTNAQLKERLEALDISVERKTLYDDIDSLQQFGMDIIAEQRGRSTVYYLGSREFELPELKLLVDSVQSAKFITEKKSQSLIKKLESLTSRPQADCLQRQVTVIGRVKADNERIYYNVDRLHDAINGDRQIRFHYFQWNVRKERVLRNGGKPYQVSPWRLMWNDEYYYLVAFDADDQVIKHFRVDKIQDIEILDLNRDGGDEIQDVDPANYERSVFRMFTGQETRVTLEAENSLAGVLIDRFGRDVMLLRKDDDHFTAHVTVAVSDQFLGWVFALGPGIRITGPEEVVDRMKESVRRASRQYEDA